MTFLSCLAIGVAFLLAVGLLGFAAVLLGCSIPIRRRPRPDARGEER
jgi:hypothetical protein